MSTLRWAVICALGCWTVSQFALPALGDTSMPVAWGDRSFDTSSSYNLDQRWDSNSSLGSSGINRGWQLGLNGENSDTGVVVRSVTSNSPAARAGIVPGDTVVCVDGDQVGRVGNQIYDLGEELNHHADSAGRVLMLMHSRSTGRLTPLQVQLTNQRGGISGSLTVTGGGTLPTDSVVTVRLENVSRPYYVVRNGQYSFRLSSFNFGEIPFELNFDPNYISNNDSYRLRAYITSAGRTIYDTQQPPFVLTKGYPTNVRLQLTPTSYTSGGGDYYSATNFSTINNNVVAASYSPVDSYSQQITSDYQRYLGRAPTSVEMAAWYQTPDLANRVRLLPYQLMASQEYYDRAGATDFAWVQRVFTEIIGKTPSSVEMDLWMRRFSELRYSRTELLNQLQMQSRR